MKIEKIEFETFKGLIKGRTEGIVMYGTGGDLNEWVEGVTKDLKDNGVIKTTTLTELWASAYILTTTGGRNDLVLLFKDIGKFDIGKMAIWRLQFGECSWVSDYVVNAESEHIDE